jgi:hypothetical protein
METVKVIGYKDKLICNISHSKFLGIFLDSTLTWSNRIELLTKTLTTTFYIIRTESALKVICHSLFHLILNCGILFWDNSALSITTFKVQKTVISVMMG